MKRYVIWQSVTRGKLCLTPAEQKEKHFGKRRMFKAVFFGRPPSLGQRPLLHLQEDRYDLLLTYWNAIHSMQNISIKINR